MTRIPVRVLGMATAVGLAASIGVASPAGAREGAQARHVLLLSIDGMHQTDLEWYVSQHPNSALAALVRHGVEFTNAQTQVPSDSYPGIVGQLTGGSPGTTGIWYDDSWNAALLPPGTTGASSRSGGAAATSKLSRRSDFRAS